MNQGNMKILSETWGLMATNGLLIGLQRFTPTICKQRKEFLLEEHANLIQDWREVEMNKCVLMGNTLYLINNIHLLWSVKPWLQQKLRYVDVQNTIVNKSKMNQSKWEFS